MPPRKRARDGEQTSVSDEQPRRSRRDRNSGDGVPFWASGARRTSGDVGSERPALAEASASQAQNQRKAKEPREATKPTRKRKRPSGAPEEEENQAPRRARTLLADGGRQDEPRPRGRPRKSDQDGGTSSATKRRSSGQDASPKHAKTSQRSNAKGKIRADEAESNGSQEPESDPARPGRDRGFIRLEAQTRTFPRSTARDTMAPLAQVAKSGIKSHLNDSAESVAAILQFRKQDGDISLATIHAVSKRITKRSEKMPFPASRGGPWGQDDQLNFASVVKMKQSSEMQLQPLRHSTAVLKQEVSRWEKTLEKEYDALRELEANARQESRDWRGKAKRGHDMAPVARPGATLGLKGGQHDSIGIFEDDDANPEFLSLSKDVKSRMESLAGNLQQIEGIPAAIKLSESVLKDALNSRLGSTQYQDLVFGGFET